MSIIRDEKRRVYRLAVPGWKAGRPLFLEVVRHEQGYAVGSVCESCGPESIESRKTSLRGAERELKRILRG